MRSAMRPMPKLISARALLMPDGLLAYHLTRLAFAQQAP